MRQRVICLFDLLLELASWENRGFVFRIFSIYIIGNNGRKGKEVRGMNDRRGEGGKMNFLILVAKSSLESFLFKFLTLPFLRLKPYVYFYLGIIGKISRSSCSP